MSLSDRISTLTRPTSPAPATTNLGMKDIFERMYLFGWFGFI